MLSFYSCEQNKYLSTCTALKSVKLNELSSEDILLFRVNGKEISSLDVMLYAMNNLLSVILVEGLLFVYLLVSADGQLTKYYGVVWEEGIDLPLDKKQCLQHAAEIFLSCYNDFFTDTSLCQLSDGEVDCILRNMKAYPCASFLEGTLGTISNSNVISTSDMLSKIGVKRDFMMYTVAKSLNYCQITQLECDLYEVMDCIAAMMTVTESCHNSNSCSRSCTKDCTNIISNSDSCSNSRQLQTGQFLQDLNQASSNASNASTQKITEGTAHRQIASPIYGQRDKRQTTTVQDTYPSSSTQVGVHSTAVDPLEDLEGLDPDGFSQRIRIRGLTDTKIKLISFSNSKANVETCTHTDISIRTKTIINTKAQSWYNYLTTLVLPRIKQGKNNGLYLCETALFTENVITMRLLYSILHNTYLGADANEIPLRLQNICKDDDHCSAAYQLQIPRYESSDCDGICFSKEDRIARAGLSQLVNECYVHGGFLASQSEISQLFVL